MYKWWIRKWISLLTAGCSIYLGGHLYIQFVKLYTGFSGRIWLMEFCHFFVEPK